jgi:hypothetical protein
MVSALARTSQARGGEVVGGQRLGDAVGEAVGPAVPAGAGEGDQVLAAGGGEPVSGWPALQQLEDSRATEVVTGDGQRGRERRQQVLAQPVAQATLVSGGAFVVAGDGAQLPMGDEGPQRDVAVQGQQAGDAGVFGVVFVAGRATAAGDQVGVDRQHHIAGVQESFHEQPVAGLDHHPDLGRVRLQGRDVGQELVNSGWGVLDPADPDHPLAGSSQGDEVERLGPVDPHSQHAASLARARSGWRRGAVLMDQSSQDDTLVGVGPPGPSPWDAVSRQSSQDKRAKRTQAETP